MGGGPSGTSPLHGLRVAITRAASQASALGSLLSAEGAVAVPLPTLELHDPPDFGPLDDALCALNRFDGVLFTSANAVDRTLGRLDHLGASIEAFSALRIAVVGTATLARLEACGLRAEIVPSSFTGEALLDLLLTRCSGPLRWLLPRALVASELLPDGLRAAGHIVRVAPAYQTLPPADPAPLRRTLAAGLDAITFASGSAVRNLDAAVGGDLVGRLRGVVVASIGPVTSSSCRGLGLCVDVQAPEARLAALVIALADHFESGRA